MKIIVPDYYNDFRCLAGDCRHSCCIGWEIDIDDETLQYYSTVEGEFAQRLEDGISFEGGTAHFCMQENGRCAFLNEKGLCDIMTNLGFDKVSRICDDHPRFRNFYSDRTEMGLGLSCEAVAQLIVNRQEKTCLTVLEDDEEWLWPEEWDFIDFREEVFSVIQDRGIPFGERCRKLLEMCGAVLPQHTAAEWAGVFLSLEKLDDERDRLLTAVKQADENRLKLPDNEKTHTALEQLLVYFVYRHLTDCLDDDRLAERAAFAVLSVEMIYLMAAAAGEEDVVAALTDMARVYSAEVEYSEENTAFLLDYLGTAHSRRGGKE